MKKGLLLAVLIFTICFHSVAQQFGNNPSAGQYQNINGIQLYYEVYGTGLPMLILHGNGGSIASHASRINFFSKHFKVIAIDSRGHGKSIDSTSVLNYEQMAADVNSLLTILSVDSCYIFGQSDGGILALLLAMKYPAKVKRIAAFAPNVQPDTSAVEPALYEMVKTQYEHPKNKKSKQLNRLLLEHPHISPTELSSITSPSLIMSGDRDAIRIEHIVSIYKSIRPAHLFIMPGATHFGANEYPDLLNSVILNFFTAPFKTLSTVDKIKGVK